MKSFFLFTIGVLPSSICVVSAGLLALHNVEGWGWFLLAAFFLTNKVTVGSKQSPEDKPE